MIAAKHSKTFFNENTTSIVKWPILSILVCLEHLVPKFSKVEILLTLMIMWWFLSGLSWTSALKNERICFYSQKVLPTVAQKICVRTNGHTNWRTKCACLVQTKLLWRTFASTKKPVGAAPFAGRQHCAIQEKLCLFEALSLVFWSRLLQISVCWPRAMIKA